MIKFTLYMVIGYFGLELLRHNIDIELLYGLQFVFFLVAIPWAIVLTGKSASNLQRELYKRN